MTPDELFAKFLGIIAGLPDNDTQWSITLCSSYFSALTIRVKDKIEEDGFSMPVLNNVPDKQT